MTVPESSGSDEVAVLGAPLETQASDGPSLTVDTDVDNTHAMRSVTPDSLSTMETCPCSQASETTSDDATNESSAGLVTPMASAKELETTSAAATKTAPESTRASAATLSDDDEAPTDLISSELGCPLAESPVASNSPAVLTNENASSHEANGATGEELLSTENTVDVTSEGNHMTPLVSAQDPADTLKTDTVPEIAGNVEAAVEESVAHSVNKAPASTDLSLLEKGNSVSGIVISNGEASSPETSPTVEEGQVSVHGVSSDSKVSGTTEVATNESLVDPVNPVVAEQDISEVPVDTEDAEPDNTDAPVDRNNDSPSVLEKEVSSVNTCGEETVNDDGPVDIDTGTHVESASGASVPSVPACVNYSSAASNAGLLTLDSDQGYLSTVFSAVTTIPGIGQVFALPSQEACDVDKYIDECSEGDGDTSTASYDLESVGKALPESVAAAKSKVENSVLDPHTDPFAARVGKTLCWRNVNMTLQTGHGQPNKNLLKNIWGEVPKTETTAIMGASGAGKTSLLNILAGRARSGGRLKIEADVRLNNYAVDPTNINVRKSIAFVAQDDSLQATATPREAIRFSAKLRLPRSTTDRQLDKLASRMIHELGLSACADTIVGGPLIKGISGGERKRASVGVELVVKPAMVFLDEPTSGLDSFSAVQVCRVLKKVANAGASVLFTIHQPSSEIFESFDHLILLHKGRVLYQGPVSRVPKYFAARGYPCPTNYNPADWVVNVAQGHPIPELEEHGFFPEDERMIADPLVPGKGQDALGITIHKRKKKRTESDERPPGLGTQVKLLFKRELVYIYRFPYPLVTRLGLTAFLSGLIGMIFFKVGEASPADTFNLQSQFGALMILLMLAMLGTAQPALLFFPEERPIFLREYSTDHYSVLSYFLSRLFIEAVTTGLQVLIMVCLIFFLVSFRGSFWMYFATTYTLAMSATAMAVMLGVISGGNAKVAQQLLPLVFIPQLLFSGFFVSPDLIPKFLRWAQYVCVLTYAVRMLILEEFYDCSDNYFERMNCNLLVDNVKAVPGKEGFYWIVMVAYFIVFRFVALILLRRSATKFY